MLVSWSWYWVLVFLLWMCMKEKTFLFQCWVVKCGNLVACDVVWTHLALHHFITTKHFQPCCKVCAKPFCWIWVVVVTIIFQLVFGIAYRKFSKWLFPTMETIMIVLDGNLHIIWSPFFIQMKNITKKLLNLFLQEKSKYQMHHITSSVYNSFSAWCIWCWWNYEQLLM
jgi:undecaprenyl pyrophosphate phosphatase UppP